jgi:demethylspheroidene O-methyltransferase
VPAAQDRFGAAGMTYRTQIVSGSFRDQPLPRGADMISLVRVLYDHSDETVADLLAAAYAALPTGGRIVISEPMTGGAAPHRAGDAYFALYCMAMRTGRARSADRIAALLQQAGFNSLRLPKAARPFITSVVEGVR